jgi:MFS family permease
VTAPARWDAARVAVATIFLLDGLTFGVWVAHLPLIRRGLHLSDLALSAALAGMVGGAFVAQPVAGALATRYGSRRLTRLASVAACLALALPALAPSLPLLVAATALLGLTRGATEVPMNAQATLYELRAAAPRMSTFHAAFSLGGFLGAGVAAVLLRLGSRAPVTLAAVGAGCAVVSALVGRHLLRDTPSRDAHAERPHASLGAVARDGVLVALGVLAFCGLFGEGAMADWSALLLERTTGAAPAAAALGYAAFSVAMTLGRATGDAVIARFGRAPTLRASGVLAAAGLTLALVAPYVPAVAGCAVVGLGYANLVPILFSASGRHAGSAGIAAVSTMGYFGFVVGPPIIGSLSQLLGSLPLALGVVALFALAIAAGASVVERNHVAVRSGA